MCRWKLYLLVANPFSRVDFDATEKIQAKELGLEALFWAENIGGRESRNSNTLGQQICSVWITHVRWAWSTTGCLKKKGWWTGIEYAVNDHCLLALWITAFHVARFWSRSYLFILLALKKVTHPSILSAFSILVQRKCPPYNVTEVY